MGEIRLSFSYQETMKEQLVKLAKKDHRTLASYIKKILNAQVKKIINKKRE